MIIGIEGPAGAGKSTMARTVAVEIGAVVIEGGAWYRALTYEALSRAVDLNNTAALIDLANRLDITAISASDGGTEIRINGSDVTQQIYSSDVDQSVAIVAQQLNVRSIVEPKIIEAVRSADTVIIVGRHIRKVLPEAKVLRLTIDEQEAERRYRHRMGRTGESVTARNERDVLTAQKLGVTVDGAVEVDVSAMDMAAQAEVLRRFISTVRSATAA